ncbi:MAG TPA: UDP-N-acetylmuramoyl-L-alanine--D-glutamate ligase [Burkholderiales bacterium]|nr:UDP-N-acetylmuramoyl-L-alanine--D-glutamate ligase [Burkholderiales bacterium]
MLEIAGKNILVLGLGATGLSMARWLARHGAHVTVADTRDAPPNAGQLARELPQVSLRCGPFTDEIVAGADMIAISPGVPRQDPSVAHAIVRRVPVIGDVECFARALPMLVGDHRMPHIVAITGSNGKSTVTEMAGAICRAAGMATVVAGNIGLPVLDVLGAIEDGAPLPDVFVLELSSFQLESTISLEPDAATVLNITEDHLDRYAGIDEYATAKARIFAGDGVEVLNRDDARTLAAARPGRQTVTFGLDAPASAGDWGVSEADGERLLVHGAMPLMPARELRVAGWHNAANALAACALTRVIGAPYDAMREALRGFTGLPHRVEKVAEIDGVTFYDDSKGTNVGATVAALNGFPQPVVLIAGGDGKGQNFAPLAPAVARARAVVLIGRDRERIAQALATSDVPLVRAATLEEAVSAAFGLSHAGDAVLLSPACASYDMFRNYGHRSEVFVAAVKALVRSRG